MWVAGDLVLMASPQKVQASWLVCGLTSNKLARTRSSVSPPLFLPHWLLKAHFSSEEEHVGEPENLCSRRGGLQGEGLHRVEVGEGEGLLSRLVLAVEVLGTG